MDRSVPRPSDWNHPPRRPDVAAPDPAEYKARCLLALAVLHHRTRTFDPTNSDVIALERTLQGLDLDNLAYGEPV